MALDLLIQQSQPTSDALKIKHGERKSAAPE